MNKSIDVPSTEGTVVDMKYNKTFFNDPDENNIIPGSENNNNQFLTYNEKSSIVKKLVQKPKNNYYNKKLVAGQGLENMMLYFKRTKMTSY